VRLDRLVGRDEPAGIVEDARATPTRLLESVREPE
jgi:hypothetical protein